LKILYASALEVVYQKFLSRTRSQREISENFANPNHLFNQTISVAPFI